MKYIQLLPALFLTLLYGCATQSVPTGGPKDTKPPKVVASEPENGAVNFSKNTINIYFDEFIKEPQGEIIISPPLDRKPGVKLKGKRLSVIIKDSLIKNTTYTINFGNTIADVNEGNILFNYRFVFSTGTFIDSLYFSGKVINAFTGMPEKDILVMLYRSDYDSVPMKKKPLYFTKTDVNGFYNITNIASGIYKVFVLKDGNNDYLFNQPGEFIAFSDAAINPAKTDTNFILRLFQEDKARQRLIRARATGYGRVVMTFARPVSPAFNVGVYKTERVKQGDTLAGLWKVKEYSKNNDSLTWWFANDDLDSLHLIIRDTSLSDTVHLALVRRKEQKKQEKDKKILYSNNNVQSALIEANTAFDLTFNTPVKTFDAIAVTLKEDSTQIRGLKITQDSLSNKVFHVKYKWKEDANYKIMIPKGAFIDIFGNTSDTIRSSFKVRPAKEYGNFMLRLELGGKDKQYLLQLLDEKGGVFREEIVRTSIDRQYEFLKPQKYKLRLIIDRNKNSKWDTGNYLQHLQPEKVIYYNEVINIRANWEIETTWKVPD